MFPFFGQRLWDTAIKTEAELVNNCEESKELINMLIFRANSYMQITYQSSKLIKKKEKKEKYVNKNTKPL